MARFMVTTVAAVLLAGVSTAAQPRAQRMDRPYDPATEVTIAGTVSEVVTGAMGAGPAGPGGRRGAMGGLHLMVETGDGTVQVRLGPARFIEAEGVSFVAGDAIEVTGSRIDGGAVVVARTITRGETTLVLRDERGVPRWSGGRPR